MIVFYSRFRLPSSFSVLKVFRFLSFFFLLFVESAFGPDIPAVWRVLRLLFPLLLESVFGPDIPASQALITLKLMSRGLSFVCPLFVLCLSFIARKPKLPGPKLSFNHSLKLSGIQSLKADEFMGANHQFMPEVMPEIMPVALSMKILLAVCRKLHFVLA
jgi:hypothetical protein